MGTSLITVAYLVASILFILSLRGLASQESSRQGNWFGIIGMTIAIVATLTNVNQVNEYEFIVPGLILALLIGGTMAARVAMTAMPELVALLHSFVGLAAVLVGFACYVDAAPAHSNGIFLVEVFLDVFIGAITFTGSIVAFLKLKGTLSGTPLLLPGRHLINLAMVTGAIYMGYVFVAAGLPTDPATGLVVNTMPPAMNELLIMTAIACVLGYHLVAAIGGADMPVVVSMLNSYSGWTASAAGFMLGNDLLIITGALVGSSGAILSYIMCKAMNRSIVSVIFGGFGGATPKSSGPQKAIEGEIQEESAEDVVAELLAAKDVIIVPGYGMAVARAQHSVYELTKLLKAKGVNVRFGIHPVAGRLPGHMNVLLAEANVPYDIVLEMEELNEDFPKTQVTLVIGANDIVNPAALEDEGCPIYGMPVLEVWNGDRTVIFKRSRKPGYAGIDNPLFYHANSRMLFGDAKDSMEKLVGLIRNQ
jgi:NAD(P) transhydrogenase subunit beta